MKPQWRNSKLRTCTGFALLVAVQQYLGAAVVLGSPFWGYLPGGRRGLPCRRFHILMRRRKKAKQNKPKDTPPPLKNANDTVTCLWTHSKAIAG